MIIYIYIYTRICVSHVMVQSNSFVVESLLLNKVQTVIPVKVTITCFLFARSFWIDLNVF